MITVGRYKKSRVVMVTDESYLEDSISEVAQELLENGEGVNKIAVWQLTDIAVKPEGFQIKGVNSVIDKSKEAIP